jgi:tRNA threonylcarbamoyladenosine biosynthesis protein TsaB
VIVLAIDTCDSRGSVAVLRGGAALKVVARETDEDYSSWLLPAVRECLEGGGLRMEQVDAYAAAAGPGSFTGVRVGLTCVKAWAEVYEKRIAAVSRLEALAAEASQGTAWVAAFFNAQRGQIFGAVYQRNGAGLARSGDEMVSAPGQFVEAAAEMAHGEKISWVSMDAECVTTEEAWKAREARGERVDGVSTVFAPMIGRIGLEALAAGRYTDPLALDANYVRRSDAEIFWKGSAGMATKTKRDSISATIRAFGEADAAAAAQILRACPEAAQWTEWGFRELLGWQGVVALVREYDGKVSGFIVGRQAGGEAEILNLAVSPAKRRKGEAGALLKTAMEEFRARQVNRVFLEVRESNEGGMAFYQKHGFSKTGRRAGYYRDPEEAAIVMEKKLGG